MNTVYAAAASSDQASHGDLVWLILAGVVLWIVVIRMARRQHWRAERRRLERLALVAIIVGGFVYWTRTRKTKDANKQDETQKHDTIRL